MSVKNERPDGKEKILNEIAAAVRQIKFGEIVITIHEGRVVQIEKREKKRFGNGEKRGRR